LVVASDSRSWVSRRLPVIHFVVDSFVWACAIPFTELLRYDFDVSRMWSKGVGRAILLAVAGQLAFGYGLKLYRRRWRYGTFDEVVVLACTEVLAGAVLLLGTLAGPRTSIPRSVAPLATAFTIAGTVAARSFWRLFRQRQAKPTSGQPVVVVGAGDAAYQIVRNLMNTPGSPFLPAALLDDDPMKAHLRMHGIRVEGMIDDLVDVARRRQALGVLMAIPTSGAELVKRVNALAMQAKLPLYVLPGVLEIFSTPEISDIRPVTDADLLGRDEADIIDYDTAAELVAGRRVLVTGAGGSIGSELCRQLARFAPTALIMLDRDESGLHAVQLSIDGHALLDSPNLVLADIRDAQRIDEVFLWHRPHVVFHAAALKHLPLLEGAPAEAWKTNIVGTQNVLDAAQRAGVERFVNISTDKAADPISVLGYSKRIAERLTADAAHTNTGTFVSVRFGNVLGSRGSVLVTFRAQALAGGPITVTHRDVTRFLMTVEEAVRLTLVAAAIGTSGEVLVLDMGEPVRILDVAERFAHQQDPPLEIVYTGLRPGEKLHEDLFATGEVGVRRVHPLISHVPVSPVAFVDAAAQVNGQTAQFHKRLWHVESWVPSEASQ
jgi:FlaA1/EpsC-like NDP-sugar epimerase